MESGKWIAVASALVLLGVSLPLALQEQPTVAAAVGKSEAPPLRVLDGFFTENAGQADNDQVKFYSSGGMQVGFAESAVLVKLIERDQTRPLDISEERMRVPQIQRDGISSIRGVMVRITFPGSNKVMPQGVQEMPHRSNYFIGNDPSKWRTGVRSYREIVYRNMYDGIDLVYRIVPNGPKYDFIVQPWADPARIRMTYEGVDSLDVKPRSLIFHTAAGDLRDDGLVAMSGGESVRCEFAQVGIRTDGFACEGWNRAHPLVIDPLLWATYLGGSDWDVAYALALDASGNAVVAGTIWSTDFPTTPGAYDVTYNGGSSDAYMSKISKDGSSLLWSTFFGGSDLDQAFALALDVSGNAFVTGRTKSVDFPATSGAYDVTYNGSNDAFLAEVSADGASLLWATYLAGNGDDWPIAIVLDDLGDAIVAGYISSTDFPMTPGAYDVTYNGGLGDAFVAKLAKDGSSLLWATCLGGSGDDAATALALDASGNIVMVGNTGSANFPTTPGAYDFALGGIGDAFVAKLSADGSSLLWATYLGGTNQDDDAWALKLDSSDNAVVAGYTWSTNFPTTSGAYDVTYNGGDYDAFVANLSKDGSSLLWATYLGGGGQDDIEDLALDGSGNVVVAGLTRSSDFPATPGAYDVTYNGGFSDAFVAKLSTDGSSLLWSTFLGGSDFDMICAFAFDFRGNAVVAGRTDSADFPATSGAYDITENGGSDAFVAKLGLQGAPTIIINSPSGGELWSQGSSHTVAWTTSDNEDPPSTLLVWVNYTSIAGSGNICGAVAGDIGSCAWTLPAITATDVVVNGTVIDTGGLRGYGESGPFTIQAPPNTPPTITITSPSGGEVWDSGTSQTIAWTASDNEDAPSALLVWINYTSSAGSGSICGPVPGDVGSRVWTVPTVTTMIDIVFNGTVVDTGGLRGYDESEVTIQAPPPPNTPPTVTMTSPTGVEEWLEGSAHKITWTMHDNEDDNADLTIYINFTTGGVPNHVAAALKGELFFTWILPGIEANDVVVNITVIDTGGLNNWSQSGPFTIKAPPSSPPDFLSQYWWLLIIIVAVAIVLMLLALMKRKRPKEEKAEVPPSGQQNPPPSD